jgi:hypothetical protein
VGFPNVSIQLCSEVVRYDSQRWLPYSSRGTHRTLCINGGHNQTTWWDSSSSCYSSDSSFQGKAVKPNGTYFWGKFVYRENCLAFVRALPRLLLTFTCSFHAEGKMIGVCVCPCSYKAVGPWMSQLMDNQAFTSIAESFKTAKCNRNNLRYTARSLVDHLQEA